jgi:Fe2+ or Zn2+ uptake regulation protein
VFFLCYVLGMERRHTKHKENILGLFREHHILTAHNIRELLPTVDTSTIYRNLRHFVSDGILREVHAESGVVSYERADTRHDHFVCDSCNRIEEMDSCRSAVQNLVPSGACIVDGSVVVHGTCETCVKTRPSRHATPRVIAQHI